MIMISAQNTKLYVHTNTNASTECELGITIDKTLSTSLLMPSR